MSDAPLFQNADEQEAAYTGNKPTTDDAVLVPGAALGGSGTGSPAMGAGTPGILPPAIAPKTPSARDDDDLARLPDEADRTR